MLPQRLQQVINAMLGAGLVATVAFTTLTATTGTFTTLTATNATISNLTTPGAVTSSLGSFTVGTLNVTSTETALALTAFTLNATTLSATGTSNITLASSTRLTVGQGTSIDFIKNATTTVNPNAIAPGQATSTVLTLTGVTVGDFCWPAAISGDLGGSTSTARLWAVAGSNQATVYMTNASSTGSAYDAGSSVLGATCLSF